MGAKKRSRKIRGTNRRIETALKKQAAQYEIKQALYNCAFQSTLAMVKAAYQSKAGVPIDQIALGLQGESVLTTKDFAEGGICGQ